MLSLRVLLFKYFVNIILEKHRERNVEKIIQTANYVQQLPHPVLDDLFYFMRTSLSFFDMKLWSGQIAFGLTTNEIAICFYKGKRTLWLKEIIERCDLDLLFQCVGHNMKELRNLKLPACCKPFSHCLQLLCQLAPKLSVLNMTGLQFEVEEKGCLKSISSLHLSELVLNFTNIGDDHLLELMEESPLYRTLIILCTVGSRVTATGNSHAVYYFRKLEYLESDYSTLDLLGLGNSNIRNITLGYNYYNTIIMRNYHFVTNDTIRLASNLVPLANKVNIILWFKVTTNTFDPLSNIYIEHLDINFIHHQGFEVFLPCLLSICENLKTLKLSGITIHKNWVDYDISNIRFPKLESLKILETLEGGNFVHLSNKMLTSLLAAAPNLRRLKIENCKNLTEMTIFAQFPRLNRLEIYYSGQVTPDVFIYLLNKVSLKNFTIKTMKKRIIQIAQILYKKNENKNNFEWTIFNSFDTSIHVNRM